MPDDSLEEFYGMSEAVSDKLCLERMGQLDGEVKTFERSVADKFHTQDEKFKAELKAICDRQTLELKALKNYIVGFGVGISIVIVLVNIFLYFAG